MKLKYLLFGGDPEYEYYEEDVYSMGLIPTLIIMIIAAAFFYFACKGVTKGMKTEKTYNNMKTNLEGNYQDLERENEQLKQQNPADTGRNKAFEGTDRKSS